MRTAATSCGYAVENLILGQCAVEGVNVPRGVQHQLDTICRLLPTENVYRARLTKLSWLEAYLTAYRYPKPAGKLPLSPPLNRLDEALRDVSDLIEDMSVRFDANVRGEEPEPARSIARPRS